MEENVAERWREPVSRMRAWGTPWCPQTQLAHPVSPAQGGLRLWTPPTMALSSTKALLVQLKSSGGSQPLSPLQCRTAFPGTTEDPDSGHHEDRHAGWTEPRWRGSDAQRPNRNLLSSKPWPPLLGRGWPTVGPNNSSVLSTNQHMSTTGTELPGTSPPSSGWRMNHRSDPTPS